MCIIESVNEFDEPCCMFYVSFGTGVYKISIDALVLPILYPGVKVMSVQNINLAFFYTVFHLAIAFN